MPRKTTSSVEDLDRLLKAMVLLSRTVDHLLETQAVEDATNFPLSNSKVQILRLLANRGEQSASQVARFLGVSKPAVTQIMDSMVRSKLVSRRIARHDRREVGLTLTGEGRRQFRAVRQRQRTVVKSASRKAPRGNIESWINTLWDVSQALADADRTFSHHCLQCGADADTTCMATGSHADALYVRKAEDGARGPARRRTASEKKAPARRKKRDRRVASA